MRFRRRRKPRVQWLPEPGTQLVQNGVDPLAVFGNPAAIEFLLVSAPGVPTTVAAPLVTDNPVSETFAGSTVAVLQKAGLNQTEAFGYKLIRIVGDIFIGVSQNNTQAAKPPGLLAQAGLIIRRVDEDGHPTAAAQEQDVGALNNVADPWIWQRNWVLNPLEPQVVSGERALSALTRFPATNVGYGTKHHIAIDQKTARRVGPEERLFFNMTIWQLPLDQSDIGGVNSDDVLNCYVVLPYRVLGTVYTNSGNRRNASR